MISTVSAPMTLLREDLLAGRTIATAGPLAAELGAVLSALGAGVCELDPVLIAHEDGAVLEWARAHAPLHGLVYDARAPFGTGGLDGLLSATQHGWPALRGVAAGALIPAGAGGKLVLIAPRPHTRPYAQAARAALENLARTLSTEWARYAITTTTITPGPSTSEADIATLLAFLLSPGGDYLSGCRFELGAIHMPGGYPSRRR